MPQRFTTTAAQVLAAAQQEARQLNHDFVGTEHVLLALLANESSNAATLLSTFGINATSVREEITKLVAPLPAREMVNPLPLTPRANLAIQYAGDEAQWFAQPLIDAEHLLLGLLREPSGVAGRALRNLGLDVDALGREIFRMRLAQMKIVERVVRPIRAATTRKRKLREEMMAHLTGIYEEELALLNNPAAAMQAASERFGNPESLAREFQRDLSLFERIAFITERWFGWRAPESAARYMFRVAIRMAAVNAVACALVASIIWSKAGWDAHAWLAAAPIGVFLMLLSADTFLLGTLYYKTRDTLWGVFGSQKSRKRVALLQCAFALVVLMTYLTMLTLTRPLSDITAQQFSFGLIGAFVSSLICLQVARTNGPIEIRDTIWACLDLNATA